MNLLDDQALLALQGPKAVEILTALGIRPEFDDIVPVDRLVFMQAGPYLWGEVRLGVSRSGCTGEDGFEISVPAEHVARSEEHTSELQSLMRISSAVFCLKTKQIIKKL